MQTIIWATRFHGDTKYPRSLWTRCVDADVLGRARALSANAGGVRDGSFAEACYNDNTIADLVGVLEAGAASGEHMFAADVRAWDLTRDEWRGEILAALAAMVAYADENRIDDSV